MNVEEKDNLPNNSTEILDAANEAISNLLPRKSKERYDKTYKKFCDWKL